MHRNVEKKSRRGQLGLSGLWMAGVGFVITAVVLAIGARILTGVKNQTNATTDPQAITVINNGLQSLSDLGGWMPLIALVVAGVLILGLLIRAFGGFGGGSDVG